jgi:uncharacterized protein YeaO (DUF488 family)
MAIRIVQLGSPRQQGEGTRIGTVRRPPRGVRKEDYARLDYYDTWLPQLAPSAELVSMAKNRAPTAASWKLFEKRYLKELQAPDNARLLDLLCALSRQAEFSIGCYCEEEKTCHRSILGKVLKERGASMK